MRFLIMTCALALVAGCNDSSDVQRLAIGSPCKASADCGTGAFFCDTDHANGYCKKSCHKDADCPSNSVCAGALMVSPGECHVKCTSTSQCRAAEGYVCKMGPDASDASGPYCDQPEPMSGDGGA